MPMTMRMRCQLRKGRTSSSGRNAAHVGAPLAVTRGSRLRRLRAEGGDKPAPAAEDEGEKTAAVAAPPARVPKPDGQDALWFASEQSLSYLDGSLAGDYGFDPLGLSAPENKGYALSPEWLAYAELIHARWAMLGAAGCIAPEVLGKIGFIPESTGLVWFRSGVIPPLGEYDYWCDPFSLFFGQVVLMQFAELRRFQDWKKPGSMGEQSFVGLEKMLDCPTKDAMHPGGFFNFMNMAGSEEQLRTMKLKEIKNGRLAMVAMFGFGAQAIATGEGPFQNLLDHIADPFNNNLFSNLTGW